MPRLTAEQRAARKLGMGSTDVVEALGLSPYEGAGPMRLFLRKTEADLDDDDGPEGEWLEWGHIQEPVLHAWYERHTGHSCLPGGHVPHYTEPWLWATIDATVIGDDRIVEYKNVASNMARHWDAYDDGGVPRYVRAQVTIGMACTGKRLADVCASVGGRPPHIWTVEYDPILARLLIDGGRDFWRLVETRTAPPLDATPATKEYLRRAYPSNEDRVVRDATRDEEELADRRITAMGTLKGAELEIARCDAALLAAIRDCDGVRGESFQLTWKVGKDGKRRQRFTVLGED